MTAQEVLKEMTLEEKAVFVTGRDFWKTRAIERLGVKQVMMCDGPHGLRKQEGTGDHLGINKSIETVCYPTAATLASSFDRDVMKRLGEALGQECQAEQVGMLLGPGLNIKRSPLCGRNFEYFSEDPCLAGQMAAAYVKALQSKGVAACAKHFACNDQETMRNAGSSNLDERTLHEIYLPAFETVVKEGKTRSLMCSYNAINGTFSAENKPLLTDILRKKWGFGGFVVSDWGAVKDRVNSVAAGLDLEMPGNPNNTGEEILDAIHDGRLSEAELDKAVLNILTFVLEAMEKQEPNAVIDRDACRALAGELAAECAVLLKNEGALPLRRDASVAFIGEMAEHPRYQGAGSSFINVPHPVGALEAAGERVNYARGYDSESDQTDEALLLEAVEAAKRAEIAVVFAGLTDAFETEGADRENMKMPENQNALISAVAKANPNTVVVLHGGSPVELPWLEEVKAVLLMVLGGEQVGKATVELLYGEKNPSGHLAETWPIRLQDNPSYLNFPGEEGVVIYAEGIFVGYRYYDKKELGVNFPFGHGLSYTSFAYSDLRADKTKLTDQETVTVSVDVTNTGAHFGKTAVQLYVRDVASTVRRPIRELRDFAKVALQPGETKTVSFTLSKRAFAYYEPKLHDFHVESGEFVLEVGESSRDLRGSVSVEVESTEALPFKVTPSTTIAQLMRIPKGAAFVKEALGAQQGASGDDPNVLGKVNEKMLQKMMEETPISALVIYRGVSYKELYRLIDELNS